jgi:hypothetical protein
MDAMSHSSRSQWKVIRPYRTNDEFIHEAPATWVVASGRSAGDSRCRFRLPVTVDVSARSLLFCAKSGAGLDFTIWDGTPIPTAATPGRGGGVARGRQHIV